MCFDPVKCSVALPAGRYFISHSYEDVDLRDKLVRGLPSHLQPYLFPPISVSPLEFASNTLIGALLVCDGVIYINAGHSRQSFWVAFEREYSLRAGKHVYSYSPEGSVVEPYSTPGLELHVFFSAAIADYSRLEPIREFMASRRFFTWKLPHDELERDRLQASPRVTFREKLKELASTGRSLLSLEGELSHLWNFSEVKSIMSEFVFTESTRGYLVVFWSRNSPASKFQQDDLFIARELGALARRGGKLWSKRWGGTRVPGYNEIWDSYVDIFESEIDRILFVRLDETPLPTWARQSVQLYGDSARSEMNRIDDLVVRLYWLMHTKVAKERQADIEPQVHEPVSTQGHLQFLVSSDSEKRAQQIAVLARWFDKEPWFSEMQSCLRTNVRCDIRQASVLDFHAVREELRKNGIAVRLNPPEA